MNIPISCTLLMLLVCGVSTRIVRTTLGRVQGVQDRVLGRKMNTYYGVPYAKPPVGDLRFKHPLPAEPWGDEVRYATTHAPMCVQTPADTPGQPLRTDTSEASEDCLYLNIWVPGGKHRNLATMVWIFGGSYTSGSINRPLYDGKYLAAVGDVIVISINYRVGALGFFYLGTDDFPGNQGMMDQVMALEWIQDNIESFGGNRQKITLFGESAGASSVGHHLLSPLTDNLFTAAILESGFATSAFASRSPNTSIELTTTFGNATGCPTDSISSMSDCIKGLLASVILPIQNQFDNGFLFGPTVDGYFIQDQPLKLLANGDLKQVNILLGVQKNEGSFFLHGTFPEIFPLTDQINVTRDQFLHTVNVFSALLGDTSQLPNLILSNYDSEDVPYAEIDDNILGDCFFKCPIVTLANSASSSKDVYMYSFEHMIESTPLPEWMGVPHSFELEFVFGHPFGDVIQATTEELELSVTVMLYWSNFAKTGNPNLPIELRKRWPKYRDPAKKYLVLDVGRRLEVGERLREADCAFWDQIFGAAV